MKYINIDLHRVIDEIFRKVLRHPKTYLLTTDDVMDISNSVEISQWVTY